MSRINKLITKMSEEFPPYGYSQSYYDDDSYDSQYDDSFDDNDDTDMGYDDTGYGQAIYDSDEQEPVEVSYYSNIAEQPYDRIGKDIATLLLAPILINQDLSSRQELVYCIKDAMQQYVYDNDIDDESVYYIKQILADILNF